MMKIKLYAEFLLEKMAQDMFENQVVDPLRKQFNDVQTLLNYIEYGAFDKAKDAIIAGTVPNAVSFSQMETNSPLCAAIHKGKTELAKFMLENGADPNGAGNASTSVYAISANQYLPIQIAAMKDNTKMMKILIDHGADVNLQNSNGQTALHLACSKFLSKAVSFLVKNGAKIDIKNRVQMTPLAVLIENFNPSIHRRLNPKWNEKEKIYKVSDKPFEEFKEIMRILKENGANFNETFRKYEDPYHGNMKIFELAKTFDVMYLLSRYGCDLTQKAENGSGRSSLHVAIYNFRHSELEEAIKFLVINNEVDINNKDMHGETPLFWLCDKGYGWYSDTIPQLYRFMIKQMGADPEITNEKGDTVLKQVVKRRKSKKIAKDLIEAGANPLSAFNSFQEMEDFFGKDEIPKIDVNKIYDISKVDKKFAASAAAKSMGF